MILASSSPDTPLRALGGFAGLSVWAQLGPASLRRLVPLKPPLCAWPPPREITPEAAEQIVLESRRAFAAFSDLLEPMTYPEGHSCR